MRVKEEERIWNYFDLPILMMKEVILCRWWQGKVNRLLPKGWTDCYQKGEQTVTKRVNRRLPKGWNWWQKRTWENQWMTPTLSNVIAWIWNALIASRKSLNLRLGDRQTEVMLSHSRFLKAVNITWMCKNAYFPNSINCTIVPHASKFIRTPPFTNGIVRRIRTWSSSR